MLQPYKIAKYPLVMSTEIGTYILSFYYRNSSPRIVGLSEKGSWHTSQPETVGVNVVDDVAH